MMRRIFLALITICVLHIPAVMARQEQTVTTIILVRHAEKATNQGDDPDLTTDGRRRAERLVEVLKDVDINLIYSTAYKRTMQTVVPLATDKALEIKSYNPRDVEKVMDIIKHNPGKTLLFSGHSNTIPALLNVLTGSDRYHQMEDTDYDNLYIVLFMQNGQSKVVQLQYGDLSVNE